MRTPRQQKAEPADKANSSSRRAEVDSDEQQRFRRADYALRVHAETTTYTFETAAGTTRLSDLHAEAEAGRIRLRIDAHVTEIKR